MSLGETTQETVIPPRQVQSSPHNAVSHLVPDKGAQFTSQRGVPVQKFVIKSNIPLPSALQLLSCIYTREMTIHVNAEASR